MPLDATAKQVAEKAAELRQADSINRRRKETETAKTSAVHTIKCTSEPMAPERDDERGETDEEEISHLQQHWLPRPNAHLPRLPNTLTRPPGTPSMGTSSMGSPATSKPCSLGTESNTARGAAHSVATPTTSILHHRQPRVVPYPWACQPQPVPQSSRGRGM